MNAPWMIRAGEEGYLADDFERGHVAIGWRRLGNLALVKTLEDIRSLYVKKYPEASKGNVANAVAMIFKFRLTMKVSDNVITYDPAKREYLVGTIASDYFFKPGVVRDYNHLRKVKWQGRVSRDSLSLSSRNSLGSTLTVFAVNEDVWSEVQSLLNGRQAVPQEEWNEEVKDELEQIREDIETKAHELIKDKILKLSDGDLEQLSAAVLRAMGYRTRVSPKGPDRGVDVSASPDGLGLQEPRIKVEVKHKAKTKIDAPDIRSFLGALRQGDRGLYVSTGGFTKEAKYEADRSNVPLTLINLDELASLLVTHYENFDIEGRTLIPLRRVYWPAQ